MIRPVTTIRDVLDFWFGERASALWFEKDPAFDAEIRERFLALVEAAAAGAHDDWLETPEGALALVVLLDQFPRNMHRGRPAAFAHDARAREVAAAALARGHDRALPAAQRSFLYLPFEHSEDLVDQDRSVALFRALGDPVGLDYAVRHREIVARFGRFPHRNAILGRASTPEEEVFLEGPQSSF
ncbi:MAG TPA: DUF924 family protein [Geminicoccaceae bacterium]|nr:DUF924 family protein [Geminicoccaceae bacterium]